MMDKTAIIRRLSKLQKMEKVKAAPPGIASTGVDSARKRDLQASIPNRARQDMRKLEEAGWTIGTQDDTDFDVVLDADGRLKIAGQGVTAKFSPELKRDMVEAVLSELHAKIRRVLGFSPNTFLIEVEAGTAIDVARALNDRTDVLYAEPNLIEPIQSR